MGGDGSTLDTADSGESLGFHTKVRVFPRSVRRGGRAHIGPDLSWERPASVGAPHVAAAQRHAQPSARPSACGRSQRWPSSAGPWGPRRRSSPKYRVSIPRLQRIIHRNDGAETCCTERDGWCLPKTSDDLRDTMSLMIRQTIRSKRPGERSGCRGPRAGTGQGSLQAPFPSKLHPSGIIPPEAASPRLPASPWKGVRLLSPGGSRQKMGPEGRARAGLKPPLCALTPPATSSSHLGVHPACLLAPGEQGQQVWGTSTPGCWWWDVGSREHLLVCGSDEAGACEREQPQIPDPAGLPGADGCRDSQPCSGHSPV